jgi:hypothetical protein
MQRRQNRRSQTSYTPNEMMDEAFNLANNSLFSDNFKNTYNSMEHGFPPLPFDEILRVTEQTVPNILNFDVKNTKPKQIINNQSNFSYFDNDSTKNQRGKIEQNQRYNNQYQQNNKKTDTNKMENNINKQTYSAQDFNQKVNDKCGIKTLLNTRSKITYPFDNEKSNIYRNDQDKILNNSIHSLITPPIHTVSYEKKDDEKQIQQYIEQESLSVNENFIETENLSIGNNKPEIVKPIVFSKTEQNEISNQIIVNQETDTKQLTNGNFLSTISNIDDNKKTIPYSKNMPIEEIHIEKPKESTNEETIVPISKIMDQNDSSMGSPEETIVPISKIMDQNDSLIESTTEKIVSINKIIDQIQKETDNLSQINIDVPNNIKNSTTYVPVKDGKIINQQINVSMADNSNYVLGVENISDIENRMTERTNTKKIDIKNHDNTIVNMNIKQELTSNMSDNNKALLTSVDTNKQVNIPVTNDIKETVETNQVDTKSGENKITEPKVEHKDDWIELTVDMIGTSFKVVGDLPNGAKLKVVNNTHLAEDNSYITSLSRYSGGQGRDKIISFLDHLFHETERNIWEILQNIRDENNVDTNVSVLQGIIGKTYVFLHRYENMRNVYRTDSSAFARLGIIRDKFFTFLNTLFRDLAIPKVL